MKGSIVMTLVELEFDCPSCRQAKKTLVSTEKLPELINRTKRIQDIFNPAIYATAYREIFVSSMCTECGRKMFGENTDAPGYDVNLNESTKLIEPIIEKMYSREEK